MVRQCSEEQIFLFLESWLLTLVSFISVPSSKKLSLHLGTEVKTVLLGKLILICYCWVSQGLMKGKFCFLIFDSSHSLGHIYKQLIYTICDCHTICELVTQPLCLSLCAQSPYVCHTNLLVCWTTIFLMLIFQVTTNASRPCHNYLNWVWDSFSK